MPLYHSEYAEASDFKHSKKTCGKTQKGGIRQSVHRAEERNAPTQGGCELGCESAMCMAFE